MTKNFLTIILILITNILVNNSLSYAAPSDFIGKQVGRYIIDDAQANNNSIDKKIIFTPWAFGFLSKDVWWVPLELNVSQRDVIEAIITPGFLRKDFNYYNNPRNFTGYKIGIGTKKQDLADASIEVANAVGRLVYRPDIGSNWTCTATHVGNNIVVTAGHCLADPNTTADACSNLSVEWDYKRSRENFSKTPEAKIIGRCTEVISWEFRAFDPTTIDHAIFRVDNAPEAKVNIAKQPDLSMGDKLQQFSHPGGEPLVWATSCKLGSEPFQYYQHDCWGAQGSSGSALINADTNELVGVLSMGSDLTHFSVRNDKSPIGCLDVATGKIDDNC